MRSIGSIRDRLARLVASTAPTRLPAGYIDPITRMLRARVAAGEGATSTTPEARASAAILVSTWLARGQVSP
jgi:hypothetical protein